MESKFALILGVAAALTGGLALAVRSAPASGDETVVAQAPSRPWNEETILGTCRLKPPPGYGKREQRDLDQVAAFALPKREKSLISDPYGTNRGDFGMGWTRLDADYYARIPKAAREIPESLAALPVVKFNNAQIEGMREIRFREHGEYDQWFLWDRTREVRACIAVHRETKRIYFFEYLFNKHKLVRDPSMTNCFQCHASGPRLIRSYMVTKVDRAAMDRFNQRILSYGAIDFGDSIDPKRLGPALSDGRCAGCHNNVHRGRLYVVHADMIRYYLKDLRAMPPSAGVEKAAADTLLRTLLHNWRNWEKGRRAKGIYGQAARSALGNGRRSQTAGGDAQRRLAQRLE